MSDLTINVRQIAQYPTRLASDGTETLLLQVNGVGGAYESINARTFVQTALEPGGFIGVGVEAPGDAGSAQIFTNTYVVSPYGNGIKWNAYTDTNNLWRYWSGGYAQDLNLNIASGKLVWSGAGPGVADQLLGSFTDFMTLDETGRLTMLLSTVTLPYDAALPMDAVPLEQLDSKLADAVQQVTNDIFNAIQSLYLPLTGGAMTGPLVLQGDATSAFMPVTLQQMNAALAALGTEVQYLPLGGGTMTGPMLLWHNAAEPLEPVTLQQLQAMLSMSGEGPTNITIDAANPVSQPFNTLVPNGMWVAVYPGGVSEISWAATGTPAVLILSDGTNIVADQAMTLYPVTGLGGLGGGGGAGDLSAFMPLSGGTFTGPVTMGGLATQNYQPVVLTQLNTTLQNYVTQTQLPGLVNNIVAPSLTTYLPLTGGQMDGDLRVLEPSTSTSATPKDYVDGLFASLRLFMGTWSVAMNTPDISGGVTSGGGEYYIAVTQNPTQPEQAGPNIPGIANAMISNGDTIIWDPVTNLWEQIRGGSLTIAEANSFYVRLDGGTMTGSLLLSANAVAPLQAVPLQQLNTVAAGLVTTQTFNSTLATYLPLAGGQMTGMMSLAANASLALQPVTLQQMNAALAALQPGTPDLSGYLQISGGTMTGPLILAGAAVANMGAVTLQQMNTALNNVIISGAYVPLQGGTMTGLLILSGNAVANLGAVTLQQMNAAINALGTGHFLALTGGTLTGPLYLSGNASANLMPVTLQQMNAALTNYATGAQLGGYLPLSGGRITGSLSVAGNIWSDNQVQGGTGVWAGGSGVYYNWTGQWHAFQQTGYVLNAMVNGGFWGNLVHGHNGLVTSVALSSGGPTGAYFTAWDNGGTPYSIWVNAISDGRYKHNVRATEVDALAVLDSIAVSQFDIDEAVAGYYDNVGIPSPTLIGDPQPKAPDVPRLQSVDPVTIPATMRGRYARHHAIGMVAQQVQEHVPEAVHVSPKSGGSAPWADDALFVSYQPFTPYLIRAIQQLKAELAALKGKLH